MEGRDQAGREDVSDFHAGTTCADCGAWIGELGHEPTPDLWAAHIVEVFDEAWDILADDGVAWVNFGDCYSGAGFSGGSKASDRGELVHRPRANGRVPSTNGIKPKDLIGQPWLAAFALRAAGWYLRQEIIWHKPNPMPESVTDRCTKAHEQIFLLSKQKRYFFDQEAIKEPVTGNSHPRGDGVNAKIKTPDGWDTGAGSYGSIHRNGRSKGEYRPRQNDSFSAAVNGLVDTRNKRSVWSIPTEPYSEAHFATFPSGLVRPCIQAGSRIGDTVIDIFGGSGTVGMVAAEYGRNSILIDLNPKNERLMRDRIAPFLGQGVLL